MSELVVAPLTNGAYGVGRGGRRRVKPVALACIHVTGNSRTAASTNLHAACWGERNYANRPFDTVVRNGVPVRVPTRGPSATGYVARDGWAILAVNPDLYFPWSNGDISAPHTANPGIRRVLALHAKGYNANEAYWEEWELVGYGTRYPITPEQEHFVAGRIAARAKKSGLPINRETVHGHWEINGVDRRNCPVPYASREVFLARIIRLAIAIHAGVPAPAPHPEDPMPGLAINLDVTHDANPFDAVGSAVIKGDKHVAFRADTVAPVRGFVDGYNLGTVQLGTIVADPLPSWAVGRPRCVVFNHAGSVHVALLVDVEFTPLSNPIPAAVDAALDKVLANGKAGTMLALEKAVAGARPAR